LANVVNDLKPLALSYGGKTFLHPRKWIILRPYDDSIISAAYAVANAGSESETGLVFVIDGSQEIQLSPGYIQALAHADGTSEYGGALLSSGGLVFKNNNEAICVADRHSPDDSPRDQFSLSPLLRSARIHLPIAPFLVRRSWLASTDFQVSARGDLPFSSSIALALNRESGIPTYAIPFSSPASDGLNVSISGDGWATDGCKKALGQLDSDAEAHLAKTLRAPVLSGDRTLLAGEDSGTVAVIAGSIDDLDDLAELACGLNASNEAKLLLLMRKGLPWPRNKRKAGRCRMPVEVIRDDLTASKTLDLALASRLEQLGDIDAVFYIDNGQEELWIEASLKRVGAVFGNTGSLASQAGAPAAIGLPREELGYTDWISALPGESLRSTY
jgi:hypothetical protein